MIMVISRRQALAGASCTLALHQASSVSIVPAFAQSAAGAEAAVSKLEARARQAGIALQSQDTAGPSEQSGTFRRLKARLLDVISAVDGSGQSEDIALEADQLLQDMHARERMNGQGIVEDPLQGAAAIPDFADIKDEYRSLFDACVVRDDRTSDVNSDLRILTLPQSRPRYEAVSQKTATPWYFIAIVHDLEVSFRFRGHLHNGDPLARRTVQVPKNRPPVWQPPSDWESSAEDAVTYEQTIKKKVWGRPDDWSLERMLYRFEIYNGFGTRAHGINTPYLWSFSTHYEKGKYIYDGRWDPNAISDQCGAAVLLFELVKSGTIERPPAST
jgi:lysozyme family protein